MIPRMTFTFSAPEPLIDGRAFERLHNRCVKEALRLEMELHHAKRFPQHFKFDAKTRYKHKPRTKGWIVRKKRRFGSRTDLVASGRTMRSMLNVYRLAVSGSGAKVVASLRTRFPFPEGGRASAYGGVTVADMREEIETVLASEGQEMSVSFKANYLRLLNEGLAKAPRLQKRYRAASP